MQRLMLKSDMVRMSTNDPTAPYCNVKVLAVLDDSVEVSLSLLRTKSRIPLGKDRKFKLKGTPVSISVDKMCGHASVMTFHCDHAVYIRRKEKTWEQWAKEVFAA